MLYVVWYRYAVAGVPIRESDESRVRLRLPLNPDGQRGFQTSRWLGKGRKMKSVLKSGLIGVLAFSWATVAIGASPPEITVTIFADQTVLEAEMFGLGNLDPRAAGDLGLVADLPIDLGLVEVLADHYLVMSPGWDISQALLKDAGDGALLNLTFTLLNSGFASGAEDASVLDLGSLQVKFSSEPLDADAAIELISVEEAGPSSIFQVFAGTSLGSLLSQ